MLHMRIGIIQLASAPGHVEYNIQRAFRLMEEAVHESDMIVLPELWTIGYNFHNFQYHVVRKGTGLVERLASFARFHHIWLLPGTLPVETNGSVENTAILFNPQGNIVGTYSKRHLFYGYLESELMKPGDHLLQADVNGIQVGIAVCYELYYPKMWRKLAKSGVTLMIVPASWPLVHIRQWDILARARAIENGICVCGCNQAGTYHGIQLGGHSLFVNPVGEAEAEAGTEDEIIYGNYDEEKYKNLGKSLAVIHLEKMRDPEKKEE